MKKVVSGGPVRAVAFTRAVAGLPDTTFFICDYADLSGPLDPRFADAVHVPDPDMIVAAGGGEGSAVGGAGDPR
jgi:hypothetical protein